MGRTGYRTGRSEDVKIREYMMARKICQKRRGSIVGKPAGKAGRKKNGGKRHGR